jgi:hypothetical protein
MSAIVIPLKPRADRATTTLAPTEATAEIIQFPSQPYSLNPRDIAALQDLAPTLDGVWTCDTLVNDDGDAWAVFECAHIPPVTFFVCRSGRRLRLFNVEGEPVTSYASMDALTTILGEVIGRRAAAQ